MIPDSTFLFVSFSHPLPDPTFLSRQENAALQLTQDGGSVLLSSVWKLSILFVTLSPMKFHDGLLFLPLLRWCLPPFKDMKGITSAPKHINCASVRPKVERADVSASALRSKYFAGASVMKNVSPCRYYSSTRVAQAEETHSRRQWNDCSQQKRHNVLFRACFLPRGWILIWFHWFLYSCAVLPINCSFSALKFISLQDPAYRPLFLKHPDPESQERFVFFQRVLTQWFLMPWARTEKVQVEAWNKKSCGHPATQQPLPIIWWHDLRRLWFGIWFWHLSTSHVMKYRYQAIRLSVESSIWFIRTFSFAGGKGGDRGGRGKKGAKVRCFLSSIARGQQMSCGIWSAREAPKDLKMGRELRLVAVVAPMSWSHKWWFTVSVTSLKVCFGGKFVTGADLMILHIAGGVFFGWIDLNIFGGLIFVLLLLLL